MTHILYVQAHIYFALSVKSNIPNHPVGCCIVGSEPLSLMHTELILQSALPLQFWW